MWNFSVCFKSHLTNPLLDTTPIQQIAISPFFPFFGQKGGTAPRVMSRVTLCTEQCILALKSLRMMYSSHLLQPLIHRASNHDKRLQSVRAKAVSVSGKEQHVLSSTLHIAMAVLGRVEDLFCLFCIWIMSWWDKYEMRVCHTSACSHIHDFSCSFL